MNTPHPLIPQGSLLDQKNQGRARVKIAVFFVLAVHGIGLLALLISGCRRDETPQTEVLEQPTNNTAAMPSFDSTNPVADTQPPVPPPFTEPATSQPPETIVQPPVPPPATTSEYTIAKGDSFSSIAKKFNVSTRALIDANPTVEPTKLQIGQKILVPPPSPAAVTSTGPSAVPTTNGMIVYEVKSGDTLTKIASQHGTTVRAIRAANELRTDRIVVGQKLKIPSKAPANGTPAPQ